eukprot:GHRR01006666.1.p1 GENE.GHRR01006666.1~~GHRR01006666.1.p1  ORF type:complete len:149 (+),score=21.20 GHRR01006666.1:183-629(+)
MGNIVCCACVDNGTVGFIERCGRFSRVAQPGINWMNPFCCEEVAGLLSLRVQQLDVACETKTRDNVFVTIVVSVQYQVRLLMHCSTQLPHSCASTLPSACSSQSAVCSVQARHCIPNHLAPINLQAQFCPQLIAMRAKLLGCLGPAAI